MIIENISPYLSALVVINSEKINLEPLSTLELDSNNGTQIITFQNNEYAIPLSNKVPIKLDPEVGDVYFYNQTLPYIKKNIKQQNIKPKNKKSSNILYLIISLILIIIFVLIIIK